MDGKKMVMILPEDIRENIKNLLQDRFDIPEEYPSEENDDFFGLSGLIAPRELTYLAYMLEQMYGIQFGMEEYDDSRFYSLTGLSEIVANMINEQLRLGRAL